MLVSSIIDLEKRCRRFFTPDTKRMEEFNQLFVNNDRFSGKVFIIGGAVRDLAFFGAESRPVADIDVVIYSSPENVADFARDISAQLNRFGGFGYKSDRMRVDFWALKNTWASVHRYARITRPEHLIKATFFDWDAVVYDISKARIAASAPNYLDRLRRRVLDVNLMNTPSPHGNLVRALRRLVMFDGKPGPKLKIFISSEMPSHSWESITEAEKKAFHVHFLSQYRSKIDFYQRFVANRQRSTVGIDDRRQLELPL